MRNIYIKILQEAGDKINKKMPRVGAIIGGVFTRAEQ